MLLISATQVLALAVWFSSTAIAGTLEDEWDISTSQVAGLSLAAQVGFITGAAALSFTGLIDRFTPHRTLAVSALLASALTFMFAFAVDSLATGMVVRFVTGLTLAGIYPSGLKLVVSWTLADRAKALGILGGSLALGTSVPYLVLAFGPLPWRGVLVVTATSCVIAVAVAVLWIRPGPHHPTGRVKPDLTIVWTMFKIPQARAGLIGYFAHMWELYAVWIWLPPFIFHAHELDRLSSLISLGVFVAFGVGGLAGCVLSGAWGDRIGREKVAAITLTISGLCCLLSPVVYNQGYAVQFTLAFVWGASVIADSGLFSAILSSAIAPRSVGAALATQTSIGFLITLITIQLTPIIAAKIGWQFALLYLVLGPVVGVCQMAVAAREPRSAGPLATTAHGAASTTTTLGR
ncbi:MFS transporter [Rhodococcus koreensis]